MSLIVSIFGVSFVLALMYYDFRYYRLPNLLTTMFALIGLLHTHLVAPENTVNHLIAGLVGFTAFILIALFYRHFRKIEGMGMGDAKFFAGVGLWSGGYALAPVALIASLSAIMTVVILGLIGKPLASQSKIPFGFFLGFGFLCYFYLTKSSMLDPI